jgi:hypothetical protein
MSAEEDPGNMVDSASAGHRLQAKDGEDEKEPVGQVEQKAAPLAGDTRPAAQARQDEDPAGR